MLRVLVLALAIVIHVHAGEADPPPLAPAAQAAIDRLAKAEEKIDADAARQRSAERQKAMKELEKVMTAVTKTGDLDGALAIRTKLDELKKSEETESDLLGEGKAKKQEEKNPAKLAVGSWDVTKSNGVSGQMDLDENKSARFNFMSITLTGTWSIEKDRLIIVWGNNPRQKDNLAFTSPDKLEGDAWDAGKGGISMVRRKG